MNGKTEKSLNLFFLCFICGNRKRQQCSFQFRNEQLHVSRFRLISARAEEASACTLTRCSRKHQRCSFPSRNERLHVSDFRWNESGRSCGMQECAMPPWHRALSPFLTLARAAASTFLHAKARPPHSLVKARSLEGASTTT